MRTSLFVFSLLTATIAACSGTDDFSEAQEDLKDTTVVPAHALQSRGLESVRKAVTDLTAIEAETDVKASVAAFKFTKLPAAFTIVGKQYSVSRNFDCCAFDPAWGKVQKNILELYFPGRDIATLTETERLDPPFERATQALRTIYNIVPLVTADGRPSNAEGGLIDHQSILFIEEKDVAAPAVSLALVDVDTRELVVVALAPGRVCMTDPVVGRACPDLYEPVCGCNGVTYSNSCAARIAGLLHSRAGACESDE